jgi:hypothetical protein
LDRSCSRARKNSGLCPPVLVGHRWNRRNTNEFV